MPLTKAFYGPLFYLWLIDEHFAFLSYTIRTNIYANLWIPGTMAPKSRKSEIWAMQTRLWDEPSNTPIAPEAIGSIEDHGI